MLSFRRLAAAACVALAVLASPALAATAPNTPPNGSRNAEGECLLDGLQFIPAGSVKLKPNFNPLQFTYTFDCSTKAVGEQFYIAPHTFETASSVEVMWNGARINYRVPENTGISNLGTSIGSPEKVSKTVAYKKGTNELILGVGCNGHANPNCYYQYKFTCTCGGGTPGVIGDPQFVGLRGQDYQVHGVAGEIYNIVSDPDLQYNSRFVFLNSGSCPVVDGVKQKACWSHPGSYLGELGLKTREGDRIHLETGSAEEGFKSVSVNGKELPLGSTLLLAGDMGSISRNSTHLAHVLIGNWDFAFENSDNFVNQRVRVVDARKLASHGLLGQTWRTATYPNAIKYIQGAVDDYVVKDKDIFGDNFMYNVFN